MDIYHTLSANDEREEMSSGELLSMFKDRQSWLNLLHMALHPTDAASMKAVSEDGRSMLYQVSRSPFVRAA